MASYHSYKGRLEVQTDGVSGSAGYNELTLIGDAELTMDRSMTPRPRRGTDFKTSIGGQIEAEITGTITWDDADTVIAAMEAAFIAGTHIGIKFLDKESGTGLTLDCLISTWNHNQSEDTTQTVAISLVPYYADTDPAWA